MKQVEVKEKDALVITAAPNLNKPPSLDAQPLREVGSSHTHTPQQVRGTGGQHQVSLPPVIQLSLCPYAGTKD